MEAKTIELKGTVFYSIWGYDQTNYDFYVVVSVSPSGKTCLVQRAKCKNFGSNGFHVAQKPTNEGYGKAFRVKVESEGGKPRLRGSVPFSDRDEYTRLATLWFVEDEDRVFYETDGYVGH